MLHHHNPYIVHYARVMVIRLEQNILRSFEYLFYFRCFIYIPLYNIFYKDKLYHKSTHIKRYKMVFLHFLPVFFLQINISLYSVTFTWEYYIINLYILHDKFSNATHI